ncbi:hypothetical protein A5755_26935 [Mycolicibacterium fortuitum]|nr:hypothetical protein A5754_12985 [Mycolicibacterium fortuitum]OBB58308.1 hypothetical protein A5755_26935 [Mycolicibacterium fortuitum]
MYIRGMAKGSIALVLSALAFAFAVYLAMWNNDRHDGRYGCDAERANQYTQQNCDAENEDQNLMYGAGAVAVGLLVLGLVRRYQPSGGRAEARPPID